MASKVSSLALALSLPLINYDFANSVACAQPKSAFKSLSLPVSHVPQPKSTHRFRANISSRTTSPRKSTSQQLGECSRQERGEPSRSSTSPAAAIKKRTVALVNSNYSFSLDTVHILNTHSAFSTHSFPVIHVVKLHNNLSSANTYLKLLKTIWIEESSTGIEESSTGGCFYLPGC